MTVSDETNRAIAGSQEVLRSPLLPSPLPRLDRISGDSLSISVLRSSCRNVRFVMLRAMMMFVGFMRRRVVRLWRSPME